MHWRKCGTRLLSLIAAAALFVSGAVAAPYIVNGSLYLGADQIVGSNSVTGIEDNIPAAGPFTLAGMTTTLTPTFDPVSGALTQFRCGLLMGMDRKAAEESMLDAVTLLGLDPSLLDRSPFELSGGQKRRVAFAGIIAMNPDILVLDEPAAGLDPAGRREIFRYILELKKRGKTILLVSHDMDEAARVSDRILVLSKGRALFDLTPEELFSDRSRLRKIGLDLPESVLFLSDLSPDFKSLNRCVFGPDQVAGELIRAARAEGRNTREPDHVRRKNPSGRSSVSGGQS